MQRTPWFGLAALSSLWLAWNAQWLTIAPILVPAAVAELVHGHPPLRHLPRADDPGRAAALRAKHPGCDRLDRRRRDRRRALSRIRSAIFVEVLRSAA
jgi:hypothetical protein